MAKIFVLMGKSASGKDTLFGELIREPDLKIKTIVGYTTRPIRSGELEGREYYFVREEEMNRLKQAGKVIECRCYQTVHGPWYYFIADDGQIDLTGGQDYLMIDTLAGYLQLAEYFGRESVIPLYIEVEDGLRLARAVERERRQEKPGYEELCRRFLADSADFSEENLKAAGIEKRYQNEDIRKCKEEILKGLSKTGLGVKL